MMTTITLKAGPNSCAGASIRRRTDLPMLLAASMIVAVPTAEATRYEFDQRRTEVRFIYKMALATQRGRFTKVTGTLDYDPAAPEKSRVTASIATASLSADEAYAEGELKGDAFFSVETAPVIAFRSIAVTPRSPTEVDLAGEITIKGITRPVTFKVNLAPHDDPNLKFDAGAQKFVARTRIQRSAFKMTKYRSFVGDEVDLEIEAIARPQRAK